MLQSFAFSKSFQLCCWSKAPQKYGTGSGPSPNSTFTLTHTVKPELQEVVLHSILSGQTNYSPFWKMHLSSSSIYFSSPPLHQPCLLLLIYCFPCGSPERNGHGDGELGYLCYLRLSRIQALNELPLWLHRPQNSGKYSPVVFPQDLWYSCPQYPQNAFVEFPKWMKSRFIWTGFEKRNTDLPYHCIAASRYYKNLKVKRPRKRLKHLCRVHEIKRWNIPDPKAALPVLKRTGPPAQRRLV